MNTTIENNKIIAEFMGYIDNGCSEEGFLINPITNFDEEINDLRYHLDWNWLMEVVEKIEETADWSLELLTTDKKEYQMLIPLSNTNVIVETKIEAVYNACIEFIKWYDEQKEV